MIYLLLLTTSVFTTFTTVEMRLPPYYFKPSHNKENSKLRAHSWSYSEGVKMWSQSFPKCGGRRQSPIRLKQSQATNVSMTWLEWGNMDIVPIRMNLTNNGHTIVLRGEWPVSRAPFIYQRHTGSLYELDHVHWHWGHGPRDGSEHKVDGRKGALEMHMVFRRAFNKVEGGTNKLVIGFIFQYDDNEVPPHGLTAVANHLESVEEPGDVVWVRPSFRAGELVPQQPTSVFLYTGSLTIPPCSEPVTWLVAAKTGYVRDYEMDAFRSVTNSRGEEMSGNIRPLQPRNNRDILMYYMK